MRRKLDVAEVRLEAAERDKWLGEELLQMLSLQQEQIRKLKEYIDLKIEQVKGEQL